MRHKTCISILEREETSLQWRHNGCDGFSNHQPHDCLLNRLFRGRSKKTSKLRVTGLCVRGTGDRWIPTQMVSNAENVSIWWRHHALVCDSNTVTNIYKNMTRYNKCQMQQNCYFPIVFVTLNVTLHWENQEIGWSNERYEILSVVTIKLLNFAKCKVPIFYMVK